MMRTLLRRKKLRRFLTTQGWLRIAFDGTQKLASAVRTTTVGGFISFVRGTVVGPWLNPIG